MTLNSLLNFIFLLLVSEGHITELNRQIFKRVEFRTLIEKSLKVIYVHCRKIYRGEGKRTHTVHSVSCLPTCMISYFKTSLAYLRRQRTMKFTYCHTVMPLLPQFLQHVTPTPSPFTKLRT